MLYKKMIILALVCMGSTKCARRQSSYVPNQIVALVGNGSLEEQGRKIATQYIAACRDNNRQALQEIHIVLKNNSLNVRTLTSMLDYFIAHNPVALSQLNVNVYERHPKPAWREIALLITARLESLNTSRRQQRQPRVYPSLPQAPGGVQEPESVLPPEDRRVLLQACAQGDGVALADFYCDIAFVSYTSDQKAEVYDSIRSLDNPTSIGAMINQFKRRNQFYALQELSDAVYKDTRYEGPIDQVIQHAFQRGQAAEPARPLYQHPFVQGVLAAVGVASLLWLHNNT